MFGLCVHTKPTQTLCVYVCVFVFPAAACPLVDPDFQLLPIHFLVDPGVNFAWGKDDSDPKKLQNLELATEDRLNVISKYLEVQRVLIPKAPLAVGEDAEDDTRPRANSWSNSRPELVRTASLESDSSNASTNGGGGKEKGENGKVKDNKEKTRMAKQMQNMAKSFGSIGRSMSKKIKKNFSGMGKHGKPEGGVGGEKNGRKASVGSVTQSTKTVTLSEEVLRDKQHVLCARLMHTRLHYQQQMMDNYLAAAKDRFMQDRELRRQQDVEMRQKAELRRQEQVAASVPQACISPECQGTGTAATSYLCPKCYDEQKSEAMQRASQMMQPPLGELTVKQAQERYSKLSPTDFQRQDTLVASGKSRFYTYANEEHNIEAMQPDVDQQALNNVLRVQSKSLNNSSATSALTKAPGTKSASVALARSSFYDEPLSIGPTADSNLLAPSGTAVVVRNYLRE